MSRISRRALLAAVAALAAGRGARGATVGHASLIAVGRLRLALGPLDPAFDLAGVGDVGAAIRADFASGLTVLLDGWVLSRTEAELCARVALRCRENPAA